MPTKEQILARRSKLDDIMNDYANRKIKPEDKELIKDMQAHDPEYNRHDLYKDRLYVLASDNFVSELSIFRYSSTIRGMFEGIEEIQEKAKENYDNEKGFVKINALKVGLDAIKLKHEILEGKAMNTSIELLGKKMRKLTEENQQLTDKSIKED